MQKMKVKLIAVVIISIILFSNYTPFISRYINGLNLNLNQSTLLGNAYLYLDEVNKTSYDFRAQGPCYILVEIEGTDFTYFMLDEEIYEVSYGLNIFPIEFSNNPYKIYSIKIDPLNLQFFKSITVEPLFIAEDKVEVNLEQDTAISFQAGGPISILTRIDFSYNWLRIELENETGESTILKRIHNTDEYPEIDPLFYCLFMERGSYIRYDINLEPGRYLLLLQGNGSLEYKVIVNSDWDQDYIDDVEEIKKEGMYDFELDPIIPDLWGFFEKSDENIFYTKIEENDFTEGYFTFFVPEKLADSILQIAVHSGTFKEVVVDDDSIYFEGDVLISDRYSPPERRLYGKIDAGWHCIKYTHKINYTSDIKILVGGNKVNVLSFPELIDSDGDGVKDLEEYSNGLNPSVADTDNDGAPDNYDNSPLAQLVLNKDHINQMVIPTDINKNTIIDIQIEKPTPDYSTNGVPRLWRGEFNVSIYPVLRMFGDKYVDDNDKEYNMDRNKLTELWGKEVKNYNVANFYHSGVGDPVPYVSTNPEYFFIFPKPAEETISYTIQVPKGHSSKNDGRLDLRFDFIWLVTRYVPETKGTELLHYYDFIKDILVQSMTMREISNVEYLLGSPDSFIENQVLWTLTQNPELGTPEDYNIDINDDIVGKGNVNYFDLSEHLMQDRKNKPLASKDTEVLYAASLFKNYDILNKIKLKTLTNPDFATRYQGDYEAYFSFCAISNVYEDNKYFFGDPEVEGESKVLYQISYNNLFDNDQNDPPKKANILGIPVAMDVDVNSKVLKISQAQGINIDPSEIPWDTSELCDRISLMQETYIERKSQQNGIPLLNFQEGIDIYKGFFDNRQEEVELSNLLFKPQPEMPALLLQNLIDKFWDYIDTTKESLNSLAEFVNFALLPSERLDLQKIENMVDNINNLKGQSHLGMSEFIEFFKFTQVINQEFLNLMDMYNDVENDYFIPGDWSPDTGGPDTITIFSDISINIYTIFMDMSTFVCDKIINSWDLFHNWGVEDQGIINKQARELKLAQKNLKMAGALTVLMGCAIVFFAAWEIYVLSNEFTGSKAEFAARIFGAACNILLGIVIIIHGVLQIVIAFQSNLVTSLSKATKVFGYIAIAIAIVIVVWDWVTHAIKWGTDGTGYSFDAEIGQLCFTTFVVGFGIAIGLASTGVGILFAGIMAALFFATSWIDINDPHMRIIDYDTKLYIHPDSKLNVRRNGGLEIGDVLSFRLRIMNDGCNPLWIRARFRVYGEYLKGGTKWYGTYSYTYDDDGLWGTPGTCLGQYGWKGRWGTGGYVYYNYDPYGQKDPISDSSAEWKKFGGYYDSGFPYEYFDNIFNSKITGATPNLHYELELEQDWESATFALVCFTYDRETGLRYTGDDAIRESVDMPVLENSISSFYAQTTTFWSVSNIKGDFYTALNEYRYKDAYDAANKVISYIEKENKMTLSFFNEIDSRKFEIGFFDLAYFLQAYGTEWFYLLLNYFENGFRATSPNPNPPYGDKDNEFIQNLWGYESSKFHLYFPKIWWNDLKLQMALASEFLQLCNSLPLRTNIKTDLRENLIDMNAVSGEVDVNLKLYLNGPTTDKQKQVTFNITAPEGFIINPTNVFKAPLSSTIGFTIIRNTTEYQLGVHFLDLKIFLGSELIYQENVPFRIKPYSLVELETQSATAPLIPGEMFYAVNVTNSGTNIEYVNFTIEGIPENFIYKGLYPDNFIDETTLLLDISPEDSIPALIIKPPRHFTTDPGIYSYSVNARDQVFNNFYLSYSDTFEVAEFYDMELKCVNSDTPIFDYETAIYTFKITNLGNVPQTFNICMSDIPFAVQDLNETEIYLDRGESKLFTLTFTPIGWGTQTFLINATSIYNSTTIELDVTILDDDIHPPEFSNFEIIKTPIDITISFNIWNENEGDDCGLSNIKIFIDNELILECTPDSTETCFSFTFNDTHGGWFMEHGIHDIRIEIMDNDFDVPNDALSNSTSGTFETTLKDIYDYIDWQLEVLKEYIDNNVYSCVGRQWIKKLSCAQWQLEKAFDYVEDDRITCGLIHDAVAKILVQIVEFKNEIFKKYYCIDEEISRYIINSTQIIRNNIVLLMGYTTGTDIGYQIALIEIDLFNLNDLIEEKINLCCRFRLCLNNHIRSATYLLEAALFKISMGFNIECCLTHAQHKLEKAKSEVNHLLCRREITQELADIILIKLNQAYKDIEGIKNSILSKF